MIRITIVTFIILLLQKYIGRTDALTCASNPCALVAGVYDAYTGYCCYDTPPTYVNAICTCPNNFQTINTPCRSAVINPIYCNRVCYNGGVCNVQNGQQICICPIGVTGLSCEYQGGVTISPIYCNRICFNGGVCNVQNGLQICVCPIGFTGPNCEVQGIQTRCALGYCQAGTCYEQAAGATIHSYCQCPAGYAGVTCNQRYFTCPSPGVFADTPQCAIGRFFYCQQALAIPGVGTCPAGQRFSRLTNRCDYTYQCT